MTSYTRRQFIGRTASATARVFVVGTVAGDTATLAAATLPHSDGRISALEKGWAAPPRSYRPHTRWWWPGNAVTKEGIESQLQQMAGQGIGGVEIMTVWNIYAKGNIPYLSEAWLEMVRHAVQTAKALDIEVSITFGAGWVFGGSWVPPEDRSKALVVSWIDVPGSSLTDAVLAEYSDPPEATVEGAHTTRRMNRGVAELAADDNSVVAVVAARLIAPDRLDGTSLTDLSGHTRGERVRWSSQVGRWRLMAFRLRYTGQQNSAQDETPPQWVVDHFSRPAMARYCDHLGGAIHKALGNELWKTIDSLYCDSFEVTVPPGGLSWSNGLLEGFRAVKGYDLAHFLPAIWWNIGDATPRVRYDINEYLHRVGLEVTFGVFSEWCAAHKVQARIQPHYRFTPEIVQGAGAAHRPETEVSRLNFDVITDPRKATASGARFYGREIVAAEAYTFLLPGRYQSTLEDLKIDTDSLLRDGATQLYNHGYFYSPEKDVAPERDWPSAVRIDPWSTWWRYYGHLAHYVGRCCWLLRQGRFVADVLVYSPQSTVWTERVLYGWDRRLMPYGDLGTTLVANGYDFDVINDDLLQNHAHAESGRLRIRDLTYRVLLLPKALNVPVRTLESIRSFVRSGGMVIAIDETPQRSVGLAGRDENDAAVRRIVAELFGNDRAGRAHPEAGRTVVIRKYGLPDQAATIAAFDPRARRAHTPPPALSGGRAALIQALRQHVPPDVTLPGDAQSNGLTFIHRRTDDLDIYFVTNMRPQPARLPVTFRVSRKNPEAWDPMTGRIAPVHVYRENKNGIEVPLHLQAYASVFLLFRTGVERLHAVTTNLAEVLDVTESRLTGLVDAPGAFAAETLVGERRRAGRTSVSSLPTPILLTGTWTLVLETRGGVPLKRSITGLASWTEDPATRHFSGAGRYSIDFELPTADREDAFEWTLELGTVGCVAEVTLNDRLVGVTWMSPHRLNVSRLLRAGRNHLEIAVTNTLHNRVAGMPDRTEIPAELVAHYGMASDITYLRGLAQHTKERREPLPPSGLLGPVRIVPRRRVTLDLA